MFPPGYSPQQKIRPDRQRSPLKRLLSGLVAVRVMGKVESVKMSGGNFPDLIDDLEQGQQTLTSGLEEIGKLNDGMRENVLQLGVGTRAVQNRTLRSNGS